MTRIAIMQPYFAPYAGYFRLASASDIFVIYDCVQFPRRGWVHRNKLPDRDGHIRWFTLPLEKAPQETAINAMRFVGDTQLRIEAASRIFPDVCDSEHPLVAPLYNAAGSLADWLIDHLKLTCGLLGLEPEFVRSSDLMLSGDLKGQERIKAIVKELGGRSYVNAPGGRNLYDAESFRQARIELNFLPPYEGGFGSILHRLRHEDPADVAAEIQRQSQPQIA